jgi:TPP-dependent pyruvate/acetoin dehydrogenase alpha subunit
MPRFRRNHHGLMKDADKKRLLREMLFARRFEERCYEALRHHQLS